MHPGKHDMSIPNILGVLGMCSGSNELLMGATRHAIAEP